MVRWSAWILLALTFALGLALALPLALALALALALTQMQFGWRQGRSWSASAIPMRTTDPTGVLRPRLRTGRCVPTAFTQRITQWEGTSSMTITKPQTPPLLLLMMMRVLRVLRVLRVHLRLILGLLGHIGISPLKQVVLGRIQTVLAQVSRVGIS